MSVACFRRGRYRAANPSGRAGTPMLWAAGRPIACLVTITCVAEDGNGTGPVVIATDGSASAEQAAVEGAKVARTLGTEAVLVYVRPSLGPLGSPTTRRS
jgi:hypothetical protein